MRMVDLIIKKRNGGILTDEEISFIINGYIEDTIKDYQVSALLMAIYFKGMTDDEVFSLTTHMMNSGEILSFKEIKGYKADKHSTGGVGDKTTLVVGPILAALGIKFPKMSGRGLGHTGGTIDKLEAIPGFKTSLTIEEFINQVNDIGIAIVGQTAKLVPADKLLYALRDVTGTVESIPLIASSIMSKKLALGNDSISLDVKVGSGAFMKNVDEARTLAELMVKIGKANNRHCSALLTNMNEPLGTSIGNSLEVIEAINTLKGKGEKKFTNLCLRFASHALVSSGSCKDIDAAYKKAEASLHDGSAYEKFIEMVKYQDGDIEFVKHPSKFNLGTPVEVKSKEEGYISRIDALVLGLESMKLGAGREELGDKIDFSVGIVLNKKTEDYVKKGEVLATIYSNKNDNQEVIKNVLGAFEFAQEKIDSPLILDSVK